MTKTLNFNFTQSELNYKQLYNTFDVLILLKRFNVLETIYGR